MLRVVILNVFFVKSTLEAKDKSDLCSIFKTQVIKRTYSNANYY